MYELYLDTTNKNLIVIILQNNKILKYSILIAWQKQTELALITIHNLLKKCKIKLKEIIKIVIANGPGSYTGIRVSITFVKTLKILNPNLYIYIINSLLLQAGLNQSISILSAYNNKNYLAIYNKGKTILKPQLVNQVKIEKLINKFKNYLIIKDFEKCNIIYNFQKLSFKFIQIKKISKLQPYYIDKLYN